MTFREITFCKNDMLIFLGTKADLWNTVPPKMAQRVFSEMLNESLSIITTRFIHVSSWDISRLVLINLSICFVFIYLHWIFYCYRKPPTQILYLTKHKINLCSFLLFCMIYLFIVLCSPRFIEAHLSIVCVSNRDGK